jgi:hypothetical protein
MQRLSAGVETPASLRIGVIQNLFRRGCRGRLISFIRIIRIGVLFNQCFIVSFWIWLFNSRAAIPHARSIAHSAAESA